jgi:hypothetical protein
VGCGIRWKRNGGKREGKEEREKERKEVEKRALVEAQSSSDSQLRCDTWLPSLCHKYLFCGPRLFWSASIPIYLCGNLLISQAIYINVASTIYTSPSLKTIFFWQLFLLLSSFGRQISIFYDGTSLISLQVWLVLVPQMKSFCSND